LAVVDPRSQRTFPNAPSGLPRLACDPAPRLGADIDAGHNSLIN
jgi:hypothetical protein